MSPANSGPDCFRSRGRETNISSAGQTGYWGAGAVEENGLAFTRLANSYSTLMLCRNVLAVPFKWTSGMVCCFSCPASFIPYLSRLRRYHFKTLNTIGDLMLETLQTFDQSDKKTKK